MRLQKKKPHQVDLFRLRLREVMCKEALRKWWDFEGQRRWETVGRDLCLSGIQDAFRRLQDTVVSDKKAWMPSSCFPNGLLLEINT